MTDFSDFKTAIADWANRQDWSDVLVTSFVRSAESKFNEELRIDRMIRFADNTITQRCSVLPDDWLEFDLVRLENDSAADGFSPIRFKPRDEFFNAEDKHAMGWYTIVGRELIVGGAPDATDGRTVKIVYYGEVPVFADNCDSWIYTKYQSMYRHAALMHADLHAVGEEDKAQLMKQLAEDEIQKLNMAHRYARASGSRLSRSRVRSFG